MTAFAQANADLCASVFLTSSIFFFLFLLFLCWFPFLVALCWCFTLCCLFGSFAGASTATSIKQNWEHHQKHQQGWECLIQEMADTFGNRSLPEHEFEAVPM